MEEWMISYYFKKVIESIYLAKLSDDRKVSKLPFMIDGKKRIFDIYLDFFGLCKSGLCNSAVGGKADNKKTENDASSSDDNDENNSSKCQEDLLMSFEKSCTEEEKEMSSRSEKLDELEGKLALDEKFANYFTADTKPFTDSNETSTRKEAYTCNVLNLYLNGEVITVKHSILQDSYLAKNINDTRWLKRNSMKCSNGRKAIVIEYCPTTFKCIINQLRLKAVMKPDNLLPPLQMDNFDDNVFLDKGILSKIFPDKQDLSFIFGKDSAILTSRSEDNHIKAWLGEVNRKSEPKLLYRGSRDGWDVSDFHRKCHKRGATLTIVKTNDGYVFGGYSDQSWTHSDDGVFKSSKDAFLFSLKCHGGLAPMKMRIKPGLNSGAVYCSSSFGPNFGSGVLSLGDINFTLKEGYTNLNSTYELPAGASKHSSLVNMAMVINSK
jgi:hypothetical protein